MFENLNVPRELLPTDPRFGVGPSLVPQEFIEKLLATGPHLLGTSHRKDAVKNLVKEIQDGFRAYFSLPSDYEVILGNGGATALWDMIGLGMVEKKSSHFVCGEFSEKWFKAHKLIPWIETKLHKVEYGNGINPFEEDDVDLIACTLNETSTGVQISEIPKIKNPNTILAVDATSGAGQIHAPMDHIDFYYFSPQKVFASEGGLFVAFVSPKAIKRIEKIALDKTRYIPEFFKLTLALENGRGNQTYNTPAITTLFYLNEQIKLLNTVGYKQVHDLAQKKADLLYQWAEAKPYLSPYIKEKKFRSNSVAVIDIDDKFLTDDLTKVLRKNKIAYDIDGYRKLGRNQLRIALFHNVSYENLEKLTKIISLAIES